MELLEHTEARASRTTITQERLYSTIQYTKVIWLYLDNKSEQINYAVTFDCMNSPVCKGRNTANTYFCSNFIFELILLSKYS